jgi:hypothetical protein
MKKVYWERRMCVRLKYQIDIMRDGIYCVKQKVDLICIYVGGGGVRLTHTGPSWASRRRRERDLFHPGSQSWKIPFINIWKSAESTEETVWFIQLRTALDDVAWPSDCIAASPPPISVSSSRERERDPCLIRRNSFRVLCVYPSDSHDRIIIIITFTLHERQNVIIITCISSSSPPRAVHLLIIGARSLKKQLN